MFYSNGEIYQGYYRNNKREGKGMIKYKNGKKFVGQFKNGLKEGLGIMKMPNNEI